MKEVPQPPDVGVHRQEKEEPHGEHVLPREAVGALPQAAKAQKRERLQGILNGAA